MTSPLALLALYACGFAWAAAKDVCSRPTLQVIYLPSPEKSCLAFASLLQSTSFLEFDNNVCVMTDACSAPTSPFDTFPLYRLVQADPQMLLLRTRVPADASPLWLLVKGQANNSMIGTSELKGNEDWYKSPIINMEGFFSKIHLTLSNDSDATPDVNLTFSVNGNTALKDSSWFSKEHLLASFPWDIESIKSATFYKFSMRGRASPDEDKRYTLRFYMQLSGFVGCAEMQGYMVVVWNFGHCSFHATPYKVSYQWVPPGRTGSMLFKNRRLSSEFRLYGELSRPYRWYKRL